MSTSRTGLRRLTIESQIVPTSCRYKPFNDPQRVILEYLIIARDKNQKIDLIAKQLRRYRFRVRGKLSICNCPFHTGYIVTNYENVIFTLTQITRA